LNSAVIFPQTFLRITSNHFGSTKIHDIMINERLEYKLKGDLFFRKSRIINMSDSTLLFENYTEANLKQLKAISWHRHNHLIAPFQFVFLVGGIGFLPLNTLNNLITDTKPVYNEKATYVSIALIATSLLIKRLGVKRVQINKHKVLKVITIDFKNLNVKDTLR
jgi:hypothetical protein